MSSKTTFGRRHFLSGLGVSLALPWFESAAKKEDPRNRRLVCVGNHLGFYPGTFFLKKLVKIMFPQQH